MSVLCIVVYICWLQPPNLPLPSSFPFGNPKFVFYVCESLSVLEISSFVSLFQIPRISCIIWYLSFSVWLTSLSMMISRSTHVAANGIISFFFMAEKYSIVSVYTIYFIHSSLDGHIDCFHVLAIVNSAAVKIGMPVSFRIMFFFSRYMPRSRLSRSYGSSIFSF